MKSEPRNPFYLLLLVACLAFVVTALAYAAVPWDNQPDWLRERGWQLVLVEVGLVIIFGLLSMALDRIRSLRKPQNPETIQSSSEGPAKKES